MDNSKPGNPIDLLSVIAVGTILLFGCALLCAVLDDPLEDQNEDDYDSLARNEDGHHDKDCPCHFCKIFYGKDLLK